MCPMAVVLLMAVFLSAACSDSKTPPPAAPKPVTPATVTQPISQATVTQPVTQATVTPVYTYNPQGRRDPFSPIIVKEDKKANLADRPPLEQYNIYEFKFAGVIWGGFGWNVMLEGPDGKGYLVRVGAIIGPNKGVVKKITQSTMVIEEKFKTYSGEIDRKEIVVDFRKKQEGTP
jgi:type IV pilus assembly protein PilP